MCSFDSHQITKLMFVHLFRYILNCKYSDFQAELCIFVVLHLHEDHHAIEEMQNLSRR